MKTARYLKDPQGLWENPTHWDFVDAQVYNPETQGTNLPYGYPYCDAGMHFRHHDPAKATHGGSYETPRDSFVSNSRKDHRVGCTLLTEELDVHKNSVSLKEAFAKN